MKRTCVLAVLCVAVAVGVSMAEDKQPSRAQQAGPDVITLTDANGVQWMMRVTPFGVTRWRESDIPKSVAPAQPNPVTVTDLGNSYRFERSTPFGHSVWIRLKSKLTNDDKALLEVGDMMSSGPKSTESK